MPVPCFSRSGTEEEYAERERLLQDVSNMGREWDADTLLRKRSASPNPVENGKKAARLQATGPAMMKRLIPVRPPDSMRANKAEEEDHPDLPRVTGAGGRDGEVSPNPEPDQSNQRGDQQPSEYGVRLCVLFTNSFPFLWC